MDTPATYWFIFQNELLLMLKEGNEHTLLTDITVANFKHTFLRQYKIAEFNRDDIYCAELPANFVIPENIITLSLRNALESLKSEWFAIATKAYSIINWDKHHQYCGQCGHKTIHEAAMFERKCPVCNLVFYPRISPSIIVLIYKDDYVLMARGQHFSPGIYALIAGFLEVGESAEEAVHREVQEEVGIQVKNLRYFGSQPWPFPDSLMIAFTAEYASGEITINHNEIEDAGWYRYDNLPARSPSNISVARKLINYYVALKESHKIGN